MRTLRLLASSAALLISGSPGFAKDPAKSILLITVNGAPQSELRSLKRLSEKGVLFTELIADSDNAAWNDASLLTGFHGASYEMSLPISERLKRMAALSSILRTRGYSTAAFGEGLPPKPWFPGFQTYGAASSSGPLSMALGWLERRGKEPVFLWVRLDAGSFAGLQEGPGGLDASLEGFLDALSKRAWLDRSVVSLLVQHDRGGAPADGRKPLRDAGIKGEFLVRAPDAHPRIIEDELIQVMDIAPTILGLADVPAPEAMRGANLSAWIRDPKKEHALEFFAFCASIREEGTKPQQVAYAVRSMDKKLLWSEKEGFEFYDISLDPDERENLIQKQPRKAFHLLRALFSNLSSLDAGLGDGTYLSEELLGILRDKGYW
jgi:arylsulfatase A-like enzyme